MVSVMVIIAICIGVHVLVLLHWKYRANKAFYEWVEPSVTRIVRVEKAAGVPLDIQVSRTCLFSSFDAPMCFLPHSVSLKTRLVSHCSASRRWYHSVHLTVERGGAVRGGWRPAAHDQWHAHAWWSCCAFAH